MRTIKRIVPGTSVYQHFNTDGKAHASASFSMRVKVPSKENPGKLVRSWRTLDAKNIRDAKIESKNRESSDARRAEDMKSFGELARHWRAAGCPGKNGQRKLLVQPLKSSHMLEQYFGDAKAQVAPSQLDDYAAWRRKQIRRGKPGPHMGGATIQQDLVILSNTQHFGTKLGSVKGFFDVNLVYHGRDRYHKDITHARDHRPESAEVIHAIAAELFKNPKTEVHGWQSLFAQQFGLRSNELLKLRRAAQFGEAGYIKWLPDDEVAARAITPEHPRSLNSDPPKDGVTGFLYIEKRSKGGENPYSPIWTETREMILSFDAWHARRDAEDQEKGALARCQWFFPNSGHDGRPGAGRDTFGHALKAVCQVLGLKRKVTPHGYRSYFATKLLRDGYRREEVAFWMGDKSVGLVDTVYTDNVAGEKLHWLPRQAPPAWHYFND